MKGVWLSERTRNMDAASRHFLRAAAALTELGGDALTLALMEASLGMLSLAKADDDEAARDRVVAIIRLVQSERTGEAPQNAEAPPPSRAAGT